MAEVIFSFAMMARPLEEFPASPKPPRADMYGDATIPPTATSSSILRAMLFSLRWQRARHALKRQLPIAAFPRRLLRRRDGRAAASLQKVITEVLRQKDIAARYPSILYHYMDAASRRRDYAPVKIPRATPPLTPLHYAKMIFTFLRPMSMPPFECQSPCSIARLTTPPEIFRHLRCYISFRQLLPTSRMISEYGCRDMLAAMILLYADAFSIVFITQQHYRFS